MQGFKVIRKNGKNIFFVAHRQKILVPKNEDFLFKPEGFGM